MYKVKKLLGVFSNDSMVAFKIIEANINNDFISFILNTPGAPHVTHLLLLKVFRSEIWTCYTLHEHTSTIPIIDWYSDYIEYLLSKYFFFVFFFFHSVLVDNIAMPPQLTNRKQEATDCCKSLKQN